MHRSVGLRWEFQKERDHWKDIDIVGKIIMKLVLEKLDGGCTNSSDSG
jgi:hypothetical protein